MFIIGLVGGSGSGKGVVGNVLSTAGYTVYDTDAVYHEMTSSRSACTEALAEAFGEGILLENGGLNRRALAAIVFAPTKEAETARLLLNKIAHSHVHRAFLDYIHAHENERVVLDAPLLFEAGMDGICDVLLAVTAPREIRIRRIMSRDGISRDAAERRISTQLSDGELISRCDYVLENNGTLDEIRQKTQALINLLNERIENHE